MANAHEMKKQNEFLDTGPLEELGKKMMAGKKGYVIKKVLDPEELERRYKSIEREVNAKLTK